jgi:two-component system NtrC family sensor kinase
MNQHLQTPEFIADLLRENQKLITMGRLTASIAHEINNPLESVTNLLFLMGEERGLPPGVRAYLALAQRELSRAVQISKQTLNFYRESQSPAPVHLEELLEEVLVLYERKISDKKLTLRRRYTSTPELDLFPGEIRQVFSNLIVNAIEATHEGGTLWIRLRRAHLWSDSGIQGLRVTVADNGAGIPKETRRRLGTPFLTTKGQNGTGLGLWVAMSIIDRNRGNLRIYSSTNSRRHGTIFSIFLPTNMHPQAVRPSVSAAATAGDDDEDESSLEAAC